MSKNNFQTQRESLTLLCSKALRGDLSIEEFYAEWPNDLFDTEFASVLYEDIEDGIQHFPGHFFTGKPDTKKWESSRMYLTLYLDKQLLLSGVNEPALIKARQSILQKADLTTERIDMQLTAIFGLTNSAHKVD